MAIRTMTTEDEAHLPNVETVTNYPGHEAGRIRHADTCPHVQEYDLSGKLSDDCVKDGFNRCWITPPLYMKTTHVGLVLSMGERNGYDDSDFYAVVWNPETGKPETIEYATTRGWTYPNGASVDATPEIQEAYRLYQQRVAAERRAIKEAEEAKTPRVGKLVKVVSGRKVPIGTIGRVGWAGKDKFRNSGRYANPNRWMLADVMVLDAPERVGIDTENGRVFLAAEAVEVIQGGAEA